MPESLPPAESTESEAISQQRLVRHLEIVVEDLKGNQRMKIQERDEAQVAADAFQKAHRIAEKQLDAAKEFLANA